MTGEDTSSAKLAKLREAYEFAEEFLRDYGTDWKLHNKLCDMLKSALAEPLRNCDVGTEHEQYVRFEKYCDNFGRYFDGEPKCYDCPLRRRAVEEGGKCEFLWAQMPYKEGEERDE